MSIAEPWIRPARPRGRGADGDRLRDVARSVWGTPNVIGRSLVHHEERRDVVGVVADTLYRSLSEPFQPLVYLPISQTASTRFLIHARVRDGQTLAALDVAVRAVDRRAAIEGATPLRAQIDRATAGERAAQWIGGIVGFVQLGLGVMVLWGLVAYAVERRTAEMGAGSRSARPSRGWFRRRRWDWRRWISWRSFRSR